MSYADIDNLYKNQDILMFRQCWAMEKIHGTSAHVSWKARDKNAFINTPVQPPDWDLSDGTLTFFSGGEKHENFIKLFDQEKLKAAFIKMGQPEVTIYGEAYGGKCQGMSGTYGKQLKFIAFDVKIGHTWLAIDQADEVCTGLGIEFVYYRKIPTDLPAVDAERDAPSEQAFRNECAVREDLTTHKKREGVVLRPLIEVRKNNGDRIVAKHKRDDFQETKTPRHVVNPADQVVLDEAEKIADEWVTPMRLEHVIDHVKAEVQRDLEVEDTGRVIKEMVADVLKESKGEIVDSKPARKAIGTHAAKMFKQKMSYIQIPSEIRQPKQMWVQ
jgi:hypothetical protein